MTRTRRAVGRNFWTLLFAAFALLSGSTVAGFLTLRATKSEAVQGPVIALDVLAAGNAYNDTTNTMTVGVTDSCLTLGPTSVTHTHPSHLVIKDVVDLVGWQARLNYIGDRMRPAMVNSLPYVDTFAAQNVAFTNLPLEPGDSRHRGVTTALSLPPAPPDNSNTAQSAQLGASYDGTQTFAISPDTPEKDPPDDISYTATSGGILALVVLQVVGDESGQQLFMNLDDGSPNYPGTGFSYFNGTNSVDVSLPSSALGDGFHGEGVTCVPQDCTNVECPGATPTPSATPADADGDGVPDGTDNCPAWPNPAQNLPPWPVPANDPDCDSFSSTVESSAGTNPNAHCGTDAWPPDINNDSYVDVIGDISRVTSDFGKSVPPASARHDIAPDPPDHFVDVIGDIVRLTGLFGASCAPP